MRKIPCVAAVVLGLLLVMAVAAELLYGTWFSKNPLDRFGPPRGTAVAISPGQLYDGGLDFTYRRDRWGFRGTGIEPSQVSILTVGGSTTNQPYLPDDATWQAVMQRELEATGHPVVVANAGSDGQGTSGHLRALEGWFPHVPGLRPHFVLFYVGLGEVRADGGVADAPQPPGMLQWIRQHSALWQAGPG